MGFNEETVPESIHAAGPSRPSRRTGTASSDGPSDSRKMEDPWYRKYVKDTSDQSICWEDFKKNIRTSYELLTVRQIVAS